jgi:autotransporter-associated beta strand protein
MLPAFADGSIVTSDQSLSGVINGDGGGGYLVQSGTLTVSNGEMTGFVTTGGPGSGGGAGLGGAVMVDTGGTAVLNDVSFSNNTAAGGEGGEGTTGGSLNNLFNSGTPGETGDDGTSPDVNNEVDPAGQPGSVGDTGGDGTDGPGGSGGVGGNGTEGGGKNPALIELVTVDAATVAQDVADLATETAELTADEALTTNDTAHETADAAEVADDSAQAELQSEQIIDEGAIETDDSAEATADTTKVTTESIEAGTEGDDPLLDPLGAEAAAESGTDAAEDGALDAAAVDEAAQVGDQIAADGAAEAADDTAGDAAATEEAADSTKVEADETKDEADMASIVAKTTTLAADTTALEDDTQSLNDWDEAIANGQLGIGGPGGNGGDGGDGSEGYGGGAGGAGGTGGQGGANWSGSNFHGGAIGGNGGAGGGGGDGGFGAGGGSGGDGGAGGPGGVSYRASGQVGLGGLGGQGGFGGGIGSNGSGFNTAAGGGGGGSGYGGSIFVNTGGTLDVNGEATFNNDNVLDGDSANGGPSGQAAGTDLFIMQGANVNLAPGAGQYIIFNGTIADNSAASINDTDVAIGQGGGLTVSGSSSGVVEFNNIDTYTGVTNLMQGVLQAQDGSNIDANSNITFDGGVLQSYGTFSRYLGTASNDVQWLVDGSNDGGGFSAIGGGLTVSLNGNAPLTWGANNFVLGTGATLDFGSTTATDDVTFTNDIDLNGSDAHVAVTANAANDDFAVLTGTLSDGALIVGNATQTGVLELTARNTYQYGTDILGGTLALAAGAALDANGAMTIAAGGVFDISGAGNQSIGDLTGAGTAALGGNTLTLDLTSGAQFDGVLTDGGLSGGTGGGLTVENYTETFTGQNSYTGKTTIATGAGIELADDGSIADSSDVVDNGALDISNAANGGSDITSLDGRGQVHLGDNQLTLTSAAGTFSGDISGIGGLTVADGGETLTGDNLYHGATDILAGGTLALSGAGTITQSNDVVVDGVLNVAGANGTEEITTLDGDGQVILGGNRLTLTDAAGTFSGSIGGAGGLTLLVGDETLEGVNSYTRSTVIDAAAALILAGAGSIADSGVADSGTLNIAAVADGGTSITTLSGNGVVTLGGNTLSITGADTSFGGVASGTGGLTVAGGAQGLSAAQSFTGGAAVAAGATLSLTGNGAIAQASGLDDDGTFSIAGVAAGGADLQTLLGDGAVALGSKNLTFTNASTDFGGDVFGAGNVTLASGQETLSGANSFTGHTVIDAGTSLLLAGAGAISESAGVTDLGVFDISGTAPPGTEITTLNGDGSVALGANTLTLTAASDDFAGSIGGTGGLEIAGGYETLTGVNGFTGAAAIDAGATLGLVGGGSVADAAVLDDDGALLIGAAGNGGSDIISLAGDGGVSLGANTLTITQAATDFAGDVSGAGDLLVSGGAQGFSGVNDFTGATVIDAGATIALAGAGAIAQSDGVTDDGVFDISAAANGGSDITTLNGDGNVTLGGNALTLTAAAGTFAGAMNGVGGGLEIAAGDEALTGVNGMTGGAVVDSGATLALSGAGSVAQASGVEADGVFDISAAGDGGSSIETLSGDGQANLGANTLTITAGSTDFAGSIDGAGGLTVAGGAQTLSGVNGFTSLTEIEAGATLALSGLGSIAESDEVTNDGVFDISAAGNGGSSIITMNGDGNVTLGLNTLTLTAADDEFAGTISGAGGVALAGGSESFGGVNVYTGNTEIDGGATLSLTGAGSVALASGVEDDGDFDISAAGAPGSSIATLSGGGVVHLGANTLTITAASDEFDGDIEDSGNLTVAGGTQTLGGVNAYSGDTAVESGATLALTGDGAIAESAQVDVEGVFDISATGDGASVTTLLGGGSVALGGETLTLTSASTDFAGTIGGAGGLVLSGGTQTLSGGNLYTGDTNIDDGTTLVLAGAGSIGDSADVINDGTFDISGATPPGAAIATMDGDGDVALGANTLTLSNAAGTFGGAMGGAGGLEVAAGDETLTGANTYTGETSVDAGASLYLAGAGSISDSETLDDAGDFDISQAGGGGSSIIGLTGGGNVNLGGNTLTLTNAADEFSGDVAGAGTLAIAAGTETLSGVNSFTGAAVVAGGATLALSGAGRIALADDVVADGTFDISAASGGVDVTSLDGDGGVALGGNTLSLTAASGDFEGVIGGAGGLRVAAGAETLSGVNLFTGQSTVDAGATLALAGVASIAASSGVTDNGLFDISAGDSGASIATLNGGGTVALGANNLTLTAASDDFGGEIGGTGGVEIAGGDEVFTGDNLYTGLTQIDGGATLALVGDGAIAASSGVDDDGDFDISAAGNGGADIETLAGDGTVNLGTKTLILTGADDTFTGVIQGTGGVTMQDGTETLSNINTDTGATDIQVGNTLALSGIGSIADSDEVTVDGVLDISGAGNGGSSITTMNGDGGVALGGNSLTLTAAADDFAGDIAGAGGLTVAGGAETLSGVNDFTGAAVIAPGATLGLSGIGAIGASTGVQDGGTFDISGSGNGGASVAALAGDGAVALGGNTLTLTAASGDFGGAMSGGGGLDVAAGDEILTGDNAFTGPAEIANGATLALAGDGSVAAADMVQADGVFDISNAANGGADIASLGGSGNVALGANTLGLTDANGSFGGDITGSGNLAVIGGAQTLTSHNDYTGETGIAPGASLVLLGTASIGASSVVVDEGLFDISGEYDGGTTINALDGDGTVNLGADTLNVLDETGVFDGTLTGTGNLNIEGGNLSLADLANTTPYQGTVNVDDGTADINQNSANQLTGPLDLDNGSIDAGGPVTLSQTISVDGNSTLNGPSTGGDTPDGTDSVILTGSITGSGTLNTTGNVIDDATGGPAGGGDVQSGTLEIGDADDPDAVFVGDIDVGGADSTLRGHGTIEGDVTSSGDVFPGGSIGKLTITGNYTQNPAGTLTIEVTPQTTVAGVDYDELKVGGTASLAGSLALQIDQPASQYVAGSVYAGVVTAGDVVGQFSKVVDNEVYPGYLSLQPIYASANAVNLQVVASPLAYHSGNAVLDNEYNEDDSQFGAMDAIFDGAPSGPASGGSMMQARAGSWVGGGGSFGQANGDRLSDYDSVVGQGFGVAQDAVIGVAYSNQQTNTQSGQQLVKGSSNGFYGYGVVAPGQWQFAAVAGGGSTALTSQRELSPLKLSAGGSQSEGFYEGALQARYLVQLGDGYVMPFSRVAYIDTTRGAFTESGAGNLDIAYGAHDGSLGAVTGGIRAGYDGQGPGYAVSPWVEVSGSGFTGNAKISDIETIGMAQSRQNSTAAPDSLVNFGAGVTFSKGAWSGSLSYQGQAASGAQLNTFAANVTYRW